MLQSKDKEIKCKIMKIKKLERDLKKNRSSEYIEVSEDDNDYLT